MKHSHYKKSVEGLTFVDVYRVLDLFAVTDPCIQHAVKKLLVAGGRGSKNIDRDIQEAIDTLERWQEMRVERAVDQTGVGGALTLDAKVFLGVGVSPVPCWPAGEQWRWMAQDSGGDWYAYTLEPQRGDARWTFISHHPDNAALRIHGDYSINPNWRDTLIPRPTAVDPLVNY